MGVSLCFALISLGLQLLCMKLVPVDWFANVRLTLSLRVSVDLFFFILATSMSCKSNTYFNDELLMVVQQSGQILHEIYLENPQEQGQNEAQAQAPAGAG